MNSLLRRLFLQKSSKTARFEGGQSVVTRPKLSAPTVVVELPFTRQIAEPKSELEIGAFADLPRIYHLPYLHIR